MMNTDEKALHALLRVATMYVPAQGCEFLRLFRNALPALAAADTTAKEQTLVNTLGGRWEGRTDPACNEIVFGPPVRALLRCTPAQQAAVVNAALARLSPLAEKTTRLERMQSVVEAAVGGLQPREKALFAVYWAFSCVDGVINSHFTAAFNDLQDCPVDVLREDPTLAGFMRAHDLAVVVYDACEACR